MLELLTLREHLPYGYVAYTGKTLLDSDVDGYNRIQDDINRWLIAGRKVPDWLLDWSYRYLRDAVER